MEWRPEDSISQEFSPDQHKIAQYLTLMTLRAEHQAKLEGYGIMDKVMPTLNPYDRSKLQGAVVQPVVYARLSYTATHPRFRDPTVVSEEGVCLVARNIDAYPRIDIKTALVKCGDVEDGILWTRQDKTLLMTDGEFEIIHGLVDEIRTAEQQGIVPPLTDHLIRTADERW